MLNLSKTEILKGYIIDKKPRTKVKIQQETIQQRNKQKNLLQCREKANKDGFDAASKIWINNAAEEETS